MSLNADSLQKEFPKTALVRLARSLCILGGAWGVGITLALLFLPLMGSCRESVTATPDGITSSSGCENQTLIESQGGVLEPITWLYLGVMSGLSLGAAAIAWKAREPKSRGVLILVIGTILAGGMLFAGFSIGFMYAPAVLLILLGGALLTLL